jgi:Arc/MetJ family transcription regulator
MQHATLDIRTFPPIERYPMGMGKRTSLIVDQVLLREAERSIGTKGPTATVRESLQRVVRQAHLERLALLELPEDFPERLEKMRQPRTFEFD